MTYCLEHGLITGSNLFWFKLTVEDCILEVLCICLYSRLAWLTLVVELLSDFVEVFVSFAFFRFA